MSLPPKCSPPHNDNLPDALVGIRFAIRDTPKSLPRHPSHWRRQRQSVVQSIDPVEDGESDRHTRQYYELWCHLKG